MRIIFLHGLESTPETSSSAKIIKENFNNVYVPHYTPNPNQSTYLNTREGLRSRCSNGDYDIAIGISIGGFWALHMTEFTNIKNVILLNPAIKKGETLYSVKLNVSPEVGGHLIMNNDDDIVDNDENYDMFKNRFKITRFESGGHRMTNMEKVLPYIDATIDHFESFIP